MKLMSAARLGREGMIVSPVPVLGKISILVDGTRFTATRAGFPEDGWVIEVGVVDDPAPVEPDRIMILPSEIPGLRRLLAAVGAQAARDRAAREDAADAEDVAR